MWLGVYISSVSALPPLCPSCHCTHSLQNATTPRFDIKFEWTIEKYFFRLEKVEKEIISLELVDKHGKFMLDNAREIIAAAEKKLWKIVIENSSTYAKFCCRVFYLIFVTSSTILQSFF